MASRASDKANTAGSEATFKSREAARNADHVGFLKHAYFRYLWVALILCGICIAGYLMIDQEPRPNGGSWYGYTLGTIGVGLIIWLSLLGIRKRRPTPGQWSLKAWTSAHVYLGLSLIVVGTLHTGFQFGWNVHTLAYALMIIVIVTGIYGVAVYATLPAKLSNNRNEMTRSQMVEALTAIDRQLESAAQPLDRKQSDLVIGALGQDIFFGGAWGRLTGAYPGCATNAALKNTSEHGSDAEAKVHALLTRRADQLGQIRRHLRIRALLEVWLFIHVPATIALLAALLAHVVSVFYYW
ncbi:MAG: hypothetical protein SXU28_12935 [Pseudomonadota bacterium]|nr:hypothetical protein [Pseudomonadota bacterium]